MAESDRTNPQPQPAPPAGRSPYGRRSEVRSDPAGKGRRSRDYQGPTYYGRPAIKPGHYRWLVIVYFFVSGLAGAAQILAMLADLSGRQSNRPIAQTGRYLALGGALLSPVLLILDLKLPTRWYNMLRIFRPTSAMSIGSWTLTLFGILSGLTAVAQAWHDWSGASPARTSARVLGIPAAFSGALLSVYTGTLLAATSVPLWASAPRLLPVRFGVSGAASATSAILLVLSLAGIPVRIFRRLSVLALVAAVAEFALSRLGKRKWQQQGLATPLEEPPLKAVAWAGSLSTLASALLQAVSLVTGQGARPLAIAGALAALGGAFLERTAIVLAGNRSGEYPEDYFRFTQPTAELPPVDSGSTAETANSEDRNGRHDRA